MIIKISPKAMFQQQEEMASSFRTMAASSAIQTAVLYALAEMAASYSLTADQTKAVNDFVHELLNLAELPATQGNFPTKTVSMTDPAQKLRK